MKKKFEKPIVQFSPLPTWIVTLTSPTVFVKMFGYIRAVLKDFFGIQFLKKFHILKTPLIHVDNPLDQKIPFTPEHIKDYLGFVNFWIRPLAMLVKVLGRKNAAPYLANFFCHLKKSYKEAAGIYRFCMTTTERPRYNKKAYFVIVHIFDPHYLCVPSLHIAVVSLCYSFFRSIFQDEAFCKKISAEQRDLWLREIYEGAIKIAETVLYVKQHSVNCIPAALYMMTKITPELFSADDAKKFLADMFSTRNDIAQETRQEVCGYMESLFARFYNEGKNCAQWNEPIKNWMKDYAQKTRQKSLTF